MLALRNSHMKVVYNLDAMKTLLDEKFILLAPFCGVPDCEEKVNCVNLWVNILPVGETRYGS